MAWLCLLRQPTVGVTPQQLHVRAACTENKEHQHRNSTFHSKQGFWFSQPGCIFPYTTPAPTAVRYYGSAVPQTPPPSLKCSLVVVLRALCCFDGAAACSRVHNITAACRCAIHLLEQQGASSYPSTASTVVVVHQPLMPVVSAMLCSPDLKLKCVRQNGLLHMVLAPVLLPAGGVGPADHHQVSNQLCSQPVANVDNAGTPQAVGDRGRQQDLLWKFQDLLWKCMNSSS